MPTEAKIQAAHAADTEAAANANGDQQQEGANSRTRSLEDLLAGLDDEARDAVLGQVSKARTEAAGYRSRVKELEPMAARAKALEDAQKTAEERANEAAADAETRAHSFRDRAVAAVVKALAADKFADPADAAHFLDLKKYVGDGDDIDTGAITTDLDDLLKAKPHLAKAEGKPVMRPDRSQGSAGNNGSGAVDPADEFGEFIKRQLTQ